MFQLIYLRFTQPRADKNAFDVQLSQLRTLLANQSAVPEYSFSKVLTEARYQTIPAARCQRWK
jgi:hypothetical protein